MVDQILCALPLGREQLLTPIFGYANRGVPGIEIIGLGQQGRSLKEKMIYLNKLNGWDIPLRKYLLCLESEEWELVKKGDRRNIELPLWLLYLKLAGKIKMRTMKDVIAAGKISSRGEIECINFHPAARAEWSLQELIPIVGQLEQGQRSILLDELLLPLRQEAEPKLRLIENCLNG
ncbi:MAG: hypothetical protein COW00_13755 [Bdellovibrio sp. CG12_big_fil_rev_8_21_14_0_65_39_13]|nr:MAG: hypothetical protein COW78_07180 [Bdellovibrio sp. CG22_combo_CG10-13_8_21_14_all_39_27]PIQ58678.1 MAG: hypothetical protein COW00_13755 [Bdellovibrio sp. CG12_big_fil_rev_8_21_14_0_65_39_13]PIR33053.1 MAG: hypothetical protein COV37_18350 [Bdellovibrio sp. CG11_big_fil_rev_8_21_14_0_20_39_38]PJB53738.1 MAG: hypothetical protein CO099_05520 [Bdellovibrio sp. CG_4_9_14_3_um_filter_39_7]